MLTLQYIPHSEIESLSSDSRIDKLLKIVKQEKIIILEGRLKKEEETELIKKTMEEISRSFKGIELSVIYPKQNHKSGFKRLKMGLMNILLKDRQGMTIIGPASIIKEIKKDPNKILLLTRDGKKRKKSK